MATVQIGILGMGFMGNCHFNAYKMCKNARVVALCDIEPQKLHEDAQSVGNIAVDAVRKDLSGIKTYTDAQEMIADSEVDVIDVTLPTYLHAEYTISALRAGKHVICEKPIATTSAEAKKMLAAAKQTRRRLFVAHCIRFWPAYAVARKIIQSGKYGSVLSAVFSRLSATPTWCWNNWLQDPRKSGSAALDLHIHDSDYILYLFGKPKRVTSRGCGSMRTGFNHIVTTYDYGRGRLVAAEGAWEYPAGFGFSMTFRVAMQKATIELAADGNLKLHTANGASSVLPVANEDGYLLELRHFIDCIAHDRDSDVVTPRSALQSLQLVEAEIRSAASGKTISVRQ